MSKTIVLVLLSFVTTAAAAQTVPSENARQALIEMFFGKPGSFERHLPNATRAALREAAGGGPSLVDQLSLATAMMKAQGARIQTFDTGSTLLVFSDDRTQSKFEVNIESDDLRADEDEIQVSFHVYKQGQPQDIPVFPALTFLMMQESSIWKLNEIALTVRLPLADPGFLKAMVASMKARQTATGLGASAAGTGSTSVASPNESLAVVSMRSILSAETTYANTYPNHGYTCALSELDGFGGDTPNEHQAMLIESRLASGKKGGYIFMLSGCLGAPATRFQLTAVPAGGMSARAFCADQSGLIRYSPDGQAASCVTRGTPLQ
jgi:hypothetical protein